MGQALTFTVPGPPAVKGSTVSFLARHGRRVVTKTDSVLLRGWSKAVAVSALAAGVRQLETGTAVRVDVVYEWPAPKRNRRRLPCVRPDVDKLARALLDSLIGIAYVDDGQVCELTVRKRYGAESLAHVTVGPL